MEYLMTYGWAILIIALTLAVLYSLGIMNPKNFLPRAPPGSCFVFRPNGPGTTDFVSLQGTCGYLPMYVASFNGVNGYVGIPNSQSLNIVGNQITLSLWFKVNDYRSHTLLSKHSYGLWLTSSGGLEFLLAISGTYQILVTGSYNTGVWIYFVGVYDGASMKVYKNSVLQGTLSITGNIGDSSSNSLLIGEADLGAAWAYGTISNVQIYNTALTPQEIQYLYQQGLGGAPVRLQNLVGWWPLNGDAKDYSGNNNHGTIYGGVTFVQNYNPP
jgi:hypothetical protein